MTTRISKGSIVDIVGGQHKGMWGKVKKITAKRVKVFLPDDEDTHYVGTKFCKQLDFYAEIEKLCDKLHAAGHDGEDVKNLASHMVSTFKVTSAQESKRARNTRSNKMDE